MPSLTRTSLPWDAIVWWEIRRIPFNLAVGVAGLITLATILEIGVRLASPGEDFIEPAVLWAGAILYGLVANALYTLGWITEVIWTAGDTSRSKPLRNRVFLAGLAGSVCLTLLPGIGLALLWATGVLR
jgi:hypothetical protein